MKSYNAKVRLSKGQVKHTVHWVNDGDCEVCGGGHSLIHEVTLPHTPKYSITDNQLVEDAFGSLHARLDLCTKHFTMMFKSERNRFPRKKKAVAVTPKNETGFKWYTFKRHMELPLTLLAARTYDQVAEAYPFIKIYFASYVVKDEDGDKLMVTCCVTQGKSNAWNFIKTVTGKFEIANAVAWLCSHAVDHTLSFQSTLLGRDEWRMHVELEGSRFLNNVKF